MKKLTLLAAVVLTGCTTAQPNYFNGKHYMTGDSDCRYAQQTANPDVIMCLNEDMERTGTRSSMSDIQVQSWYAQKNQASTSFSSTVRCKKAITLNSQIVEYAGSFCPVGWVKI